jgi:hypothetical protein
MFLSNTAKHCFKEFAKTSILTFHNALHIALELIFAHFAFSIVEQLD